MWESFEQHLIAKDKLKCGDIVRRYATGSVEYVVLEITRTRDCYKLATLENPKHGIWFGYAEISEVVKTNHMRVIR